MHHFSATVVVITVAAIASYANSECLDHKIIGSHDFDVQCSKVIIYSVQVHCRSDNWTKFLDTELDLPPTAEVTFDNCSYPAALSVRRILDSMKINIVSKVSFSSPRAIPNRHNLKGLSVPFVKFDSGNFVELPSDLLYDVLNVGALQISNTPLERISSSFFGDWAENVLDVYIYRNELREIEPGAFDRLVRLNNLDLRSNRLHTLPSGIFHKLAKLTALELSGNLFDELRQVLLANTKNLRRFGMSANSGNLSTLPRGFFKGLVQLDTVILMNVNLDSLPADLFTGCSQLKKIQLSENKLRNIPLGLFNDTKNLRNLYLYKNQLESLPAHIFKELNYLTDLYIQENQLTSLMSDVLEDLKSIKIFDASCNELNRIDSQFIVHLKSAYHIYLTQNQLTFDSQGKMNLLEYQVTSSLTNNPNRLFNSTSETRNSQKFDFDPSVRLKVIDLSKNSIAQINPTLLNIQKYSKELDLTHNQISKINLSDFSLELFNETGDNGKATFEYRKVYLEYNPLHCDCDIADFAHYLKNQKDQKTHYWDDGIEFKCASPSKFKNQDIRDIRLEELNCSLETTDPVDACTETCVCEKYPGKQVLFVDCSYKNLTAIPQMIGNMKDWSIELNMTGNLLQHSPSLGDSYLANVTILDLSNNNITKVTRGLFSPKLQHLKLHGNSISRLDFDVIEYLAHNDTLRSITLHGNRWICDCEARKLVTFVQKKFTIYGFDEMKCHGSDRKLYKITVTELCEGMIVVIAVACLSIALLSVVVVASLVVLYHNYQREIKVWLYSKQWCLWLVTEEELDKDKEYDAFISFSHKDEDFVEKEIVAKLEEGPRPYKLCLHYRDWLAGEWIPVQISRSVAESRRTIVILTPNFLESVWGLMEFRAAHTQALKEGRTRLIVILYGEIGNVDDLDQEMKDYLRLNTYIKWGDPWFWEKLKYALPHDAKKPVAYNSRSTDAAKNLLAQFSVSNSSNAKATSKLDVIPVAKYTSTSVSVNMLNASSEDERLVVSCS